MVILIGPDHSGKSTLADEISKVNEGLVVHTTYKTQYKQFLNVLLSNTDSDLILDRCAICEYAYHKLMGRPFKFTLREWHNLMHLMIARNPLIILSTHIPDETEYDKDQYLPYELVPSCLERYQKFLNKEKIFYVEYDYVTDYSHNIAKIIAETSKSLEEDIKWWWDFVNRGNFATGRLIRPEILIVAERIGPNNVNMLPFETGPTGAMMADMIKSLQVPLGHIAITNYVKADRKDPRPPNDMDNELLEIELKNIEPKRVLLMGAVAKKARKVVEKYTDKILELPHFGSYHHTGRKDMSTWYQAFSKFMGYTEQYQITLTESYGPYDKKILSGVLS